MIMACRNGICSKRSRIPVTGSPATEILDNAQSAVGIPTGIEGQKMPKVNTINPRKDRTWLQYFGEGAFGTPDLMYEMQPYNENQTKVLDFLLSNGMNQFKNPYQGFEPIKQSSLSSFFQDIIPALMERFSSSGSNSATSPVLHSQLSGAGATLAERLAAMQATFGQQQQGNALQQLQLGINPRSQFMFQPGAQGLVPSVANTVAAGAGYAGGRALANYFMV